MDIQSMTLLANMLARKFNIDVRAEGTQAMCEQHDNGMTTITVPAFTVESDAQRVYVRGYIDHEIGHARFTKFDTYTSVPPAERALRNILEDVYVERMMGKCYPGCGLNLKAMQRQLFEEDRTFEKFANSVLPEQHDNKAPLVYWLIMRYILYRARGVQSFLDRSKRELEAQLPNITDEIEPLMQKISQCNSTKDNNALAAEIYVKLQKYLEKDNDDQQQGEQGSNSNQSKEQSSDEGQQSSDEGQQSSDEGQQSSDEGQQQASESGADKMLRETVADIMKCGGSFADVVEQELNNALRKAINMSASKIAAHNHTFRMPEPMINARNSTMVGPMPAYMRREAEGCASALAAQLHAFMQAKGLRKRRAGLYGKLDNNKLHRIVMNNPRVFLRTTEVKQVNTQVLILCDASGSMCDNSKDMLTSEAVYALMKALRNIHGVRSGAYAFGGKIFEEMAGFDTPLHRSKFNLAYCTGNTPGGSALQRLLHEFDLAKDDRKIVLLLTDGDFDGGESRVFKAVYKEAQNAGIDVIGVGINSLAVKQYWKNGDFFYIGKLNELAPKLFEILKARLV